MAINPNSPVTVIEGIGPATSQLLNDVGIFHVFDLLRATATQIHRVVGTVTTEEKVAEWQMMARFLQIDLMTPQWAEGLVREGIESVEELSNKSIYDVESALTNAQTEGYIPDVPNPEQIVDILRDATVIHHTGALMLTIRDSSRIPVQVATVDIGGVSEETDSHGRVRLIRIPLGIPQTLRVQHSDFGMLVLHDAPVSGDSTSIGVTRLTLPNRGDPEDAFTHVLSEYEGDEIDTVINMPFKAVVLAESDLRNEDLLMVQQFYKSSPDIKLVSLLRDYKKGEVVVYQYRVPLSAFNSPPNIGEHYVFRDGTFSTYRATDLATHLYRVGRQVKKAFAGQPLPTTPEDIRQDQVARFQYCVDHGACFGFRRDRT
jgi:hypothetical protein